jgi:hypothetical protein
MIARHAYDSYQRGNPRPITTFRPDAAAWAYIRKQMRAEGAPFTAVMHWVIDLARDAQAELGGAWGECARRAEAEGVSLGTMLGRLVKAGLKGGK